MITLLFIVSVLAFWILAFDHKKKKSSETNPLFKMKSSSKKRETL